MALRISSGLPGLRFVLYFTLLSPIPYGIEGTGRQVSYVGCMKRSMSSSFKKRVDTKNETSMSVKKCVEMCWYRRLKMAGIQAERQCYCSFSTSGLSTVPEKECRSRCTGNCYQACGGPNALSVYKTGYTREPTFVIEKKAYLPAFIGCYDSRTALDILCPLRLTQLWTRRLTIPMCIYYCDAVHQTKFSTVAAPDKCCCSDSVHGTRNTVLAWCDFHGKPCDGDKKQGCIGTQEKTYQWSTHQRDRIPNFKRWPKSTFTEGKWLKPNFKAGEKYLMSELTQPVEMSAGDATLMGLLAKAKARKKTEDDTKGEPDNEGRPLVGSDKRNPDNTETKVSAGVVDVPKKTAVVVEEKEEEEGTNGAIIAVVVIGFLILLAAVGFYLYSQNLKKEDAKLNAGMSETDVEKDKDWDDDGDDDDDDDDGDGKVRRRKKKKKKKKKKDRRRSKSKEENDAEANDTDNEEEDDDTKDEYTQLLDLSSDNV